MMKRLIFFTLLLISLKGWAASTIADIQIKGEIYSTTPRRILRVLPFKIGDPFEEAKLTKAVEQLQRWGIFDKVEASGKPAPAGTIVEFQLHEGVVIGDIDIRGNYPYIESQIRKQVNLRVGNILKEEELEEQAKRIKRFYLRKGYFNTVVDIKTEPAPVPNTVLLVFHVIKGERMRYSEVVFEGVKAFPLSRLHSFISVMSLHSKRKLRAAMNSITHYYRRHGYLKAKVRLEEKKIDRKTWRVVARMIVKEGPRVKIFYRGSHPYKLRTLKRNITLYDEGNFDSIELQASANKLIRKFHNDGYYDARVTFKRRKIRSDLYHIFFFIDSGPRRFVYKINFAGNENLSARKLKKQMFTQEHSITEKGILDETLLKDDRKALQQYYQTEGFPDAEISKAQTETSASGRRINVNYQVTEGPQVIVEKIVFNGGASVPEEKRIEFLENRAEKPFNKVMLAADKDQVQLAYANHGYPYATVEQKVERRGDRVTVIYNIEEGPIVKIGDILYVGDVLTSVRAMRQALRIRRGEIYSQEKIAIAQLRLRQMSTFNNVVIEPIGLDQKETTVNLKVQVEERRPFVLDMEGRYSTDTRYAGTLKFTNYNSFGWGKQTRLVLLGGIEQDRAEISWLDPLFLGSDVQMSLSSWMDYEKEPIESSLQTGGGVSFFHSLKRFGFLERYQLTRNYILEGQAKDPTALRDTTLSEIGFSTTYEGRDNYADPRRGIFGLAGAQLFNEIGGLGAVFAKLKVGFNHYLPLMRNLTWGNFFRLDRIENLFGTAVVPQHEILKLGGDDTVRGFREDRIGPLNAAGRPLGGRLRFIVNSELHIHMGESFQTALFYDTGSLTDSFGEIDSNTVRHSVGLGFRYITPVGPVRADYGIILDRQTGENFGRFHLTFGYPL